MVANTPVVRSRLGTTASTRFCSYSVDSEGHKEIPHGQAVKVDAGQISSWLEPLQPATPFGQVSVEFHAQETGGLNLICEVTLYVSQNAGPFQPFWHYALTNLYKGTAIFQASIGNNYGFYSIARDCAGREEHPKTAPEAFIRVGAPTSAVWLLPEVEPVANFIVHWSGQGSGAGGPVKDFDIFVSENNGTFQTWLHQTTQTQAWFAGVAGHSYAFYALARDEWLEQTYSLVPRAVTQIAAIVPGDVNADGRVNCSDISIVKASFGKRAGQPGFDARADLNHDGVVDVRDLAAVSQKLIPGTTCP